MLKYHHLEQIDSTNAYLQRKQSECDIRNWVVSTDEQTAGKGMGNNGWESEAGENLTFSLALEMSFLPAERQFLLSEAVALGLIHVLEALLPAEKLSIKWPNDIYYESHKLAGILINSTIKANRMDVSIIGIGLNVNQMRFQDWPTHPISMKQIIGKEYDLQSLLEQIVEHLLLMVEQLKSDPAAIEPAGFGERSLRICPNPSDGAVTLVADGIPSTATVQVYNLEGRLMCGGHVGTELDRTLSSLPQGIYLIRIVTAQTTVTLKMLRN